MKNIFLCLSVMGLSYSAFSQNYYESSGQTSVFRLASGATAGPSGAKQVVQKNTARKQSVQISIKRDCVVIGIQLDLEHTAEVAVYSLSGKQIFKQPNSLGTLRISNQLFASGIYTVVVKRDREVYSSCFAFHKNGN